MSNKELSPFGRAPFWRGGGEDGLAGFRRQMERFFEDATRDWPMAAAWRQDGMALPKVDLVETEAGLELTADLPGVEAKDIALEIDEDELLIKASHSQERREDDEKRQYHLVERAQGQYQRRFSLPFQPEPDSIKADFDKGVLKVMIPRSQKAAAHKHRIAIGGAAQGGVQPSA